MSFRTLAKAQDAKGRRVHRIGEPAYCRWIVCRRECPIKIEVANDGQGVTTMAGSHGCSDRHRVVGGLVVLAMCSVRRLFIVTLSPANARQMC